MGKSPLELFHLLSGELVGIMVEAADISCGDPTTKLICLGDIDD